MEEQLGDDPCSQHPSVHPEPTSPAINGGSDSYVRLYEALATGNTVLVQWYLDRGLGIDHIAHNSASLLHCAARAGQTSMVQYLIANGASVDVVNSHGRRLEPPIHEAILSGNPDTVACLLRAGYKKEDCVGLHRFLGQCRSTQILTMCLTHVGKMDDPYFYYKILEAAAKTGQVSIVRALLSSDKDVSIHGTIDPSTADTDISVLPNKLQVPWGPDQKRVDFFTPLHHAAAKGHTEIVRLLLGHNFDFHLVGRQGITPLHLAAREGSVSVVEFLIGLSRIDVNYPDDHGHTPLHLASRGGVSEVVRVLLGHPEIKANCRSRHNMKPLHVSALYGHWDIAQILLSHERSSSENPKPTLDEAEDQLVPSDIMRRIFEDCDFPNVNLQQFPYGIYMVGEGLLHLAVRMGDCDLLRVLFDHEGININLLTRIGRYVSPLWLAASLNELEAARLLLQHKDIDINMETSVRVPSRSTPIQIARDNGHDTMVNLLLAHGARDDEIMYGDANHRP